ncbi:MAG: phosphoethanolamine--lipid A transferase, partial [Magnetococcales bacterium]|nr:phosphoethanolamine--lipid A transferase [Magnetococcales bacterium]
MKKPLSHWGVAALCALWLLSFYNGRFWQEMWQTTATSDSRWLFVASLFLVLFLLFTALLNLLSLPGFFKPPIIFLLLLSSVSAYFVNTYGVYINRDMLHNVFLTDLREVRDLLSPSLYLYLLFLGILPALLLARLPMAPLPWRGLPRRLSISFLCVVAAVGVVYGQFAHYAAYFRNHRESRHLLVPVNTLYATGGYLKQRYAKKGRPFEKTGEDIHRRIQPPQSSRKRVVVLIVGETARAANFQLGGYGRPTNPQLSQVKNLVYFDQATSCGTDTATSLPCMFAYATRDTYDADRAHHRENLLDVVKRGAIRVVWLDNQAGVGCKGLCNRVEHQELARANRPEFCDDQECHDEILVQALAEVLNEPAQESWIVLHQMGSHGPAYYKRYPKAFQRFEPVCTTPELNNCTQSEIVNAYDNTILYTDHVAAGVIRLLQSRQEQWAGMVLYASDHGESLGEKNLYLHGIPYRIAPREQTHIPMLMWFSDAYLSDYHLDPGCLLRQKGKPVSHFNLFSTILGAFDLGSSTYHPEQDILGPCRQVA